MTLRDRHFVLHMDAESSFTVSWRFGRSVNSSLVPNVQSHNSSSNEHNNWVVYHVFAAFVDLLLRLPSNIWGSAPFSFLLLAKSLFMRHVFSCFMRLLLLILPTLILTFKPTALNPAHVSVLLEGSERVKYLHMTNMLSISSSSLL